MRRALVATLLLLAACRPSAKATLDPYLARYNTFVRHMQGDSIAAMYAEGGELVTGRGTIRGPDSIRAFLAGFTDVSVDSSAMWADSVLLTDSGAVQWGRFYQKAIPVGRPPVVASGHFVALWLRAGEGRWALRRMRAY